MQTASRRVAAPGSGFLGAGKQDWFAWVITMYEVLAGRSLSQTMSMFDDLGQLEHNPSMWEQKAQIPSQITEFLKGKILQSLYPLDSESEESESDLTNLMLERLKYSSSNPTASFPVFWTMKDVYTQDQQREIKKNLHTHTCKTVQSIELKKCEGCRKGGQPCEWSRKGEPTL